MDDVIESQEISTDSSEQSLKDKTAAFLTKVKEQMDAYPDIFRENLFRIYDQINALHPGTVFFLDRSARPVAWMVEGLHQGLLESGKLAPEQKLPEFQYISIPKSSKGEITPEAISEAQSQLQFDRGRPILIVDDFSESRKGMRLVDRASEIMQNVFQLNPTNIHSAVYFDGYRRPAEFYNAHGLKDELYGIQDATTSSIISKPATSPLALYDLKQQYQKMFTSFGQSASAIYTGSNK